MGKKRIAVMQPYFFPYIGYFQLLQAVDCFVLYDNLQYTKKGWINRNRFLCDGTDVTLTIPLRKASDFLDIDERCVAEQFDRGKLLRRIGAAYRKAPHLECGMECITRAIEYDDPNLFRFVKHSIELLCEHFRIRTEIVDSSSVSIDHSLRGQEKVLAICQALEAEVYINAIGGLDLYDDRAFESCGIELRFIDPQCRPYRQLSHPFVPRLSILDHLMFRSTDDIRAELRGGYSLVEGMAIER